MAMKTLAATAIAGEQAINNQLKAVAVMATEMATMKAATMTMETKGMAAAAEAQQQRVVGGQLGGGGGSLAIARCWRRWRCRQRQVAAATFVSIVTIVAVIIAISVAVVITNFS